MKRKEHNVLSDRVRAELEAFKASLVKPKKVTLFQMEPLPQKKVFNRKDYFSKKEACAYADITPKRFDELVAEHKVPEVNKDINLGTYTVKTRYVLKEDFIKIILD